MKKILTLLLVVAICNSNSLFALTSQTISFEAITTKIVSVGTFTIGATAQSGLAVGFSVTTGSPSIVASVTTSTLVAGGKSVATVTLSGTAVGSVTIQANQLGDGVFAAAPPASRTFTVSKIANTFTFPAVANQTFASSGAAFAVSPTPSYTATVNFGTAVYTSSNTAVATVDPSTGVITCVGGGSVTITGTIAATATQLGCSASRTFTVSKYKNTFTFPTVANQTFTSSGAAFAVSPTPTYTSTVNFGSAAYTSSDALVATVDPNTGVITCIGAGSVAITGTVAGNSGIETASATRTFTVSKFANTFTFPTVTNQTFASSGAAFAVSPTPSYTATVNFGSTVFTSSDALVATVDASTGAITCVGGGPVTITATIPAMGNIAACSASRTFTVSEYANTFTFPVVANQTFTSSGAAFVVSPTPSYTATVNFGSAAYTSSDPLVASVNPTTGAITCISAGTAVITGTIPASGNIAECSASRTFTISKYPNTFTLPTIANQTFASNGAAFAVSPTPSYTATVNFGSAVYTSSNTAVATVDASTGDITCIGAGTVTIRGTIPTSGNIAACTATKTFTVSKFKNVFTFPTVANQKFGSTGAAFDVTPTPSYTATANFGSAAYTSSDALVATVDPSTGVITCLGAGSVTITGSIAATTGVAACSTSRTFTVTKFANTFTFPTIANQTFASSGAAFAVSPTPSYTATANFGSAVYTSSDALVATVNSSTGAITCVGGGAVTITATIPAIGNIAACSASRSFTVSKYANTFTFPTVAKQTFASSGAAFVVSPTPSYTATVNFGSAVYTSSNTSVATVDASTGAITCISAGNATIVATIPSMGNIAECTASRTFVVAKYPNTFTFPALAAQTFTTTLTPFVVSPTPSYTATVNLGSAVYTSSDAAIATVNASTGAITCIGAGSAIITATIPSIGNIAACSATRTLTVKKFAQTITFTPIGNQWPSDAPTAVASSNTGLPIVFSVVSGPAIINSITGDITPTGPTGTVKVRASQAGNGYCLPKTVDVSFSIITEGDPKSLVAVFEEETSSVDPTSTVVSTNLTVYPNPSDGGVFTISQGSGINEIAAFDMLGNRVSSKSKMGGVAVTSLDLSGSPSGVYLVKITSNSGTETKRVVIQ